MKLHIGLLVFVTEISCLGAAGLSFEPNRGQTAENVEFVARTAAGAVFVTAESLVFNDHGSPLAIRFGQKQGHWQGQDPTGNVTHYRIGRDRSKWISGLSSYRRIVRKSLYPGVDLVLYGNDKDQLEYDFVVAPGADPTSIVLDAGKDARIDRRTGDLLLANGAIRQHKPVVKQGSKRIDGEFVNKGKGAFGFRILGAYDRTQSLVIDPVVESKAYLGGGGEDSVTTVTDLRIVGTTTSIDFPGAPGRKHGTDVFVRIPNGDDSYLGNTTLIMGGTGDEYAAPSSLMNQTTDFVAGWTNSTDLPTDIRTLQLQQIQLGAGIHHEYQGGASDGFVWVIRGGLDTINGNTVGYIGTSGEDRVTASSGPYLVGWTNGSGLLPSEGTSPQSASAGGVEGFLICVVNSTTLVYPQYATYLGGSGDDRPLAVSFSGNEIVVGGETSSNNFPGSPTATRKGASDAFLTRFSIYGGRLLLRSSTVFGGSGSDRIQAVTWRVLDKPFIAVGTTSSTEGITQVKPLQKGYGGGASDALIAMVKPDLSEMLQLAYVGGSGDEEGLASDANLSGNVFAGGWTSSRDFPQIEPFQQSYGGGATDGFVVFFDSAGGSVKNMGYYGGPGDDAILAVKSRRGLSALIGGRTTSSDLAGPIDPANPAYRGGQDGFVSLLTAPFLSIPSNVAGSKGYRMVFRIDMSGPAASGGKLTLESSAPSLVLATFSYANGLATAKDGFHWTGSDHVPIFVAYECQADSGEANLTFGFEGYEPQVVRVMCVQPALTVPDTAIFSSVVSTVTARVAAIHPQTGEVFSAFKLDLWGQRQNPPPEVPEITAESSDAAKLAVSVFRREQFPPSAPIFLSSNGQLGAFSVKVSAPGYIGATAQIDVIERPPRVDRTFAAATARTGASSYDLGKDLKRVCTRYYPAAVPAGTTIIASTPDLLQVSFRYSTSISSSLSVPTGATSLEFEVHGLASSGTGKVTFRTPGQADVEYTFRLRPAGYVFRSDTFSLSTNSTDTRVLLAGPVDPATLEFLEVQQFQPRVTAPSSAASSTDPAVATLSQQKISAGTTAGRTTLTLIQPAGFVAPSVLQQAVVSVTSPNSSESGTNSYFRVVVRGSGTVSGKGLLCSGADGACTMAEAPPTLTAKADPGWVLASWPCADGVECPTNSLHPEYVAIFVPASGPLPFAPRTKPRELRESGAERQFGFDVRLDPRHP